MSASPRRRDVLRASGGAVLGVCSLTLPAAAAAASPGTEGSIALTAASVTLTPVGYDASGSTGALAVSWTAVEDATSYQVWARVGDGSFAELGDPVAAPATSMLARGLPADVTLDVYVVASADDPVYAPSTSATASASTSIATGGTIGTYTDSGATCVVHAFRHDGAHEILVGRGGTAGANSIGTDGIGGDGTTSAAFGTVAASGGGGGGTWTFDPGALNTPGRSDGSCGGGAGKSTGSGNVGGTAASGEGSDGGSGFIGLHGGGGGGGAGSTGTTATDGTSGAAGGVGLAVPNLDAELATLLGVGEVGEGGTHSGESRAAGVYFAGGGGAGAGPNGAAPENGADGPGGLGGGGRGRRRDDFDTPD